MKPGTPDELRRARPCAARRTCAPSSRNFPEPLADCSSTYALLKRGAERDPEAPALSFFLQADDFQRPFVWTHREWIARITQTANLLRRHGLGRGDTVAYVLPNLPETHWVIWGGETAGRVLALNPLLEPAMLRELMAGRAAPAPRHARADPGHRPVGEGLRHGRGCGEPRSHPHGLAAAIPAGAGG